MTRVNEDLPGEDGVTLLLVEDDRDSSQAFTLLLGAVGYRVLAASSAWEALDIWRRERETIRVVLTDLAMPQMSGADLYRALCAEDIAAPVIVVSGYPRPAVLMAGVAAWLQKPVDIDELLVAIKSALRGAA
jgi:DNA-binding response OmpR family regulator